jgi:hypothetical protein
MHDDEGIVAGIAPRIDEIKIAVARALLAVRRGDRLAAELLLINAQRTLTQVELGLVPRRGRDD